ncbi:transcription initiation factor TFIID 23-30kDa subunit-domain-containing protein [Syncephalis plumigaleata]|nr:transcription initiation factor TFIID 23-30kDa subunit-domain-containing protein [Syncephalis plumigaleata]
MASSTDANNNMDLDTATTANVSLSRREEEMLRRDRTLAETLLLMDNCRPIIPDAVTDYYLSRAGLDCQDVRIKRLLALAAQKFISDVATDAYQYCKIRQQSSRDKRKDRRTVLTMEDLSSALNEHGINVRKPEYYM